MRDKVLQGRKNLKEKTEELKNLGLGKIYINESQSIENNRLSFKCRQLVKIKELHSTWFYNQVINVRVRETSRSTKIFHINDLDDLLGYDVDECLNKL